MTLNIGSNLIYKTMVRNMVLRLNGTSRGLVGSTNQALTNIANARIENEVSRAVARHENALKVDGSQIYMWLRGNTGLVCTCRQPKQQVEAQTYDNTSTVEDLREPLRASTGLPPISRNGGFKVVVRDSVNNNMNLTDANIPPDLLSLTAYPNQLDNSKGQDDNELQSLNFDNTEVSDAQLASILSEGAAVFGGDKTACGICFGTGKTHGYELATGRRLILDASNEYPFQLNNASIKPNTYPSQFYLNSNGSVQWTVDLPAYTEGWLNFTIKDNLNAAPNLILEWFYKGVWQQLTLIDLSNTEGSDRTGRKMRVRIVDGDDAGYATFTHCEIIYATMPPLIGQAQPFTYTTDYETSEPVIRTEFEMLANVADIPRESVFQDSKYKYLWKVTDTSPKMTEKGQVFSLMISARVIHRSELLYALKVIYDPLVTVNYRGLELDEGGLQSLDTNSYYDGKSLVLKSS